MTASTVGQGGVALSPDFELAALRHHADADLLISSDRHVNADHLAGLATECALKAILLGFCGAKLNANQMIEWTGGGQVKELRMHVDKLWNHVSLNLHGRNAPAFAALLQGESPFSSWSVADRYGDGANVTTAVAARRLAAARQVVSMLQLAKLAGALP